MTQDVRKHDMMHQDDSFDLWRRTEVSAPGSEPLAACLQDARHGLGEVVVEHVGDALGEHLGVHLAGVREHVQRLQVLPAVALRLGEGSAADASGAQLP